MNSLLHYKTEVKLNSITLFMSLIKHHVSHVVLWLMKRTLIIFVWLLVFLYISETFANGVNWKTSFYQVDAAGLNVPLLPVNENNQKNTTSENSGTLFWQPLKPHNHQDLFQGGQGQDFPMDLDPKRRPGFYPISDSMIDIFLQPLGDRSYKGINNYSDFEQHINMDVLVTSPGESPVSFPVTGWELQQLLESLDNYGVSYFFQWARLKLNGRSDFIDLLLDLASKTATEQWQLSPGVPETINRHLADILTMPEGQFRLELELWMLTNALSEHQFGANELKTFSNCAEQTSDEVSCPGKRRRKQTASKKQAKSERESRQVVGRGQKQISSSYFLRSKKKSDLPPVDNDGHIHLGEGPQVNCPACGNNRPCSCVRCLDQSDVEPPSTKRQKLSRDASFHRSSGIPPTLNLGSHQLMKVVSPTVLVSWNKKNEIKMNIFDGAEWQVQSFSLRKKKKQVKSESKEEQEKQVDPISQDDSLFDCAGCYSEIILDFLDDNRLVIWEEYRRIGIWTKTDGLWSCAKFDIKLEMIKGLMTLGGKHVVALSKKMIIWTEGEISYSFETDKRILTKIEYLNEDSFILHTHKNFCFSYFLLSCQNGTWKETDLLAQVDKTYNILSQFIPLANDRFRFVLTSMATFSYTDELVDIMNNSRHPVLIGVFESGHFLADSWREVELDDAQFKLTGEKQLVAWSEQLDQGCNKVKVWTHDESGDWNSSEVQFSEEKKFKVVEIVEMQEGRIVLLVKDTSLEGDSREFSNSLILLDVSESGQWSSRQCLDKQNIDKIEKISSGILLIESLGEVRYLDILELQDATRRQFSESPRASGW